MLFQLSVNRLREARLGETYHLRALNIEKLFQVGLGVMLDNGVMHELIQNLRAAVF